jgi:TonB family protein
MKRSFNNVNAAILALILSFAAVASANDSFKPAEALSVTDAYSVLFYATTQIVPDAFVVLDLCLTSKGSIERVDVLRDPVSMGKIAASSVRTWKFRPASEEGAAVASQVPVVFVYRPPNFGSLGPPKGMAPINVKPVIAEQNCDSKTIDFVPATILAAAYPDYPVNSVAWGSAVIQVSVDAAGSMRGAEVLRAMPSFTQFALAALKKWRFQAATLAGQPVASNVIIALVFQTPSP